MSRSSSAITNERKGYGRGMILGLTMAETFLLLVFCLLLVAAASIAKHRAEISHQRSELSRLNLENETLKPELAELTQRVNQLQEENNRLFQQYLAFEKVLSTLPNELVRNVKVDDDWREIALVQTVIKQLATDGISAPELVQLSPSLAVLEKHGFLEADPEDVAERLEKLVQLSPTVAVLEKHGFLEADPDIVAEQLENLLVAEGRATRSHDWPPIINLSEADRFSFSVGSAELSPEFKRELQEHISDLIAGYLEEYDVDIVEIIGHTDEQPIEPRPSTLDGVFGDVLRGQMAVTAITPGDNAGLGLARAIAVMQALQAGGKLSGVTILPLSAAQLIMPGDALSDGSQTGNIPERRRIEIRMRQRPRVVVPKDQKGVGRSWPAAADVR